MNRRDAMMVGCVMMAGSVLNAEEKNSSVKVNTAYGKSHEIIPLSFNPKKTQRYI